MTDPAAANLAHWISQYPNRWRWFTHPSRIAYFQQYPPGDEQRWVKEDEWKAMQRLIGPLTVPHA